MKTLSTSLFLIVLLAFSSCKKDEENPAGNLPPVASQPIRDILQQMVQPSVHDINAQFPGKIRTDNYGEFIFAPNSFVNGQGEIVTGNIRVEVTEIYSNSDFFFSGQAPLSDDNFLITGGQFNIEAYQNGELLQPSSNYFLEARVPTNDVDNNMDLFIGEEDPDGIVNWLPGEGEGNLFIMGTDSVINDCFAFCGVVELDADQTISLSYTNNGGESESAHTGYLYTSNGEIMNFTTGSDFNYQFTATTDGITVNLCLYDQQFDGWMGSYVTVDVDGEAADITVNSDDCEPVPFSYFYTINTTHYGWINCDYFAGQNADSQLTVFVEGDHDCMTTVMYTFFTDEEAMGPMYCDDEAGSFLSYTMPSGSNVIVAALSNLDGQYYSAFETVNVVGNMEIDLTLEETTLAEFEMAVDQL